MRVSCGGPLAAMLGTLLKDKSSTEKTEGEGRRRPHHHPRSIWTWLCGCGHPSPRCAQQVLVARLSLALKGLLQTLRKTEPTISVTQPASSSAGFPGHIHTQPLHLDPASLPLQPSSVAPVMLTRSSLGFLPPLCPTLYCLNVSRMQLCPVTHILNDLQ